MELRSILDLPIGFRRLEPDFCIVAAPVNRKFRKCQLQTLGRVNDDAVSTQEMMEAKLSKTPVMAVPRWHVDYTVETDAYEKQIGFVLLENVQDGSHRQIVYRLHSLIGAKWAYGTAHLDCFAAVFKVLFLLFYFDRCLFIIITDHDERNWVF